MRSAFIIFPFLLLFSCRVAKPIDNDAYYIYIRQNDIAFHKEIKKGGYSIVYSCKCYARQNDMAFTHADTSESVIRKLLPGKTINMAEFAQIANTARLDHKSVELWHKKKYIIEKLPDGKYQYYKVQFYPIELDD